MYIYFSNKEDLLVSTFLTVKSQLSEYTLSDFSSNNTLKENVRNFWLRLYEFVSTNKDDYQYIDQFSNSPFIQRVDTAELEQPYAQFHQALQHGIEQGVIKDIPLAVLRSFILAPAVFLARSRLATGIPGSEQNIDIAFSLAWDAITP